MSKTFFFFFGGGGGNRLPVYGIAGNFQGIYISRISWYTDPIRTLKYFSSITLTLSIAKICENYFLDIDNESKFTKYRALENNQLYGN